MKNTNYVRIEDFMKNIANSDSFQFDEDNVNITFSPHAASPLGRDR